MAFKKGDWITNDRQIGRVKDAYSDDRAELIDVQLYDFEGNKRDRESPAMGGPTTFEPACAASNWRAIRKPSFPIERLRRYDLSWMKGPDDDRD